MIFELKIAVFEAPPYSLTIFAKTSLKKFAEIQKKQFSAQNSSKIADNRCISVCLCVCLSRCLIVFRKGMVLASLSVCVDILMFNDRIWLNLVMSKTIGHTDTHTDTNFIIQTLKFIENDDDIEHVDL